MVCACFKFVSYDLSMSDVLMEDMAIWRYYSVLGITVMRMLNSVVDNWDLAAVILILELDFYSLISIGDEAMNIFRQVEKCAKACKGLSRKKAPAFYSECSLLYT